MIIPHSLERGRAGNANTNQAMTEARPQPPGSHGRAMVSLKPALSSING
jgi:hypothetical protein